MSVDADAGDSALLEQVCRSGRAEPREVHSTGLVLPEEGRGVTPFVLPAAEHDDEGTRFDESVLLFPAADVLDRQLIVGVGCSLVAHVDHYRAQNERFGWVSVDADAAFVKAVGRVHVGGTVLTDREAAQVIAVGVEGSDCLELDRWIARPEWDALSDHVAEVADAGEGDRV